MKKILMTGMFALLSFAAFCASSPMRVVEPKCEYLKNPICIDIQNPRFSWMLQDSRKNAAQSAYRILVGTDSAALIEGKADMWDSGKQISSKNNGINYAGKEFSPRTKYYWAVHVWDSEGVSAPLSEISSFETAMWRQNQWKGYWIDDAEDINFKPAPYFRKEVKLNGDIVSARAYISGVGYYRFSINGKRVGDDLLSPVFTKYDKKTSYMVYDVTDMLSEGENALGVILGNGWFNDQAKAVWEFDKAPWRDRPKFILNLYVTYADGTSDVIYTDNTWKVGYGPLQYNNLYVGENYDARLEMPGWDKPGFDDSSWKNASRDAILIYRTPSTGELKAQIMPPIRIKDEIKPKSVNKISDKLYVYDMGENFAGLTKIKVKGEEGTTLRLMHGERLFPDGRVDMKDIAMHMRFDDSTEQLQTSHYTLRGGDMEEWMPEFTYYGFRYVEVSSDRPIELDINSLTGYRMYTDVADGGTFECSNPLVNKILEIGLRSYKSNLFGIFTDCPHREKNGWTGDAQLACEVGMYNFKPILAYENFVEEVKDAQYPSGIVPGIVPSSGWGYHWGNGPAWDAALILMPWYVYLYYGDDNLIRNSYENCRLYMDYLSTYADDYIVSIGLGDWCMFKSETPVELTSTLYYYVFADLMSRYAQIMGIEKDAREYAELAENIKAKVNEKFYDPKTGIYATGSQTAQSAPIFQGVVDSVDMGAVAGKLVDAVHAADDHLDVGLLGSKYLLNALTATGNNALAYKVASQSTLPSWGYWVKQGYTTMHEQWNSNDSRNHIMFGEICAWMYKALGGINPDPEAPGYKHIILRPGVDTPLTYAKATTHTPNGDVTCNWERSGKKNQILKVNVVIPVNSTATLYLPDDEDKGIFYEGERLREDYSTIIVKRDNGQIVIPLGSGSYEFELK